MSWKTKEPPFSIEKPKEKLGYVNNPRWTKTAAPTHKPCGYWLNNDRSVTTEEEFIEGTQWVLKADRLNTQDWIWSMVEYDGDIYGGTGRGGRLFKWNGSDAWTQVAPELLAQDDDIRAMVVYNDKIYGATGRYGNYAYEGRLLEWNGVDAWTCVADHWDGSSGKSILSLCVFNNSVDPFPKDRIYAGVSDGGVLLEWNDVDAWVLKTSGLNSQYHIAGLCVFNNKLYGGTRGGGRLFEWNGTDAWTQVAPQYSDTTNIYSLCVFNNKLYGAGGRLLEWNGIDAWTEAAPKVYSYTFSLKEFKGKLYSGAYGFLLQWNGTNAWEQVADRYGGSADNVPSLLVYNDQLYSGTGRIGAGAGGLLVMWDSVTHESKTTHSIAEVSNAVWPMD